MELWAFSTTADDVRIRNSLYNLIGANNTRKVLAKMYPGGTATKDIEKRLANFKEINNIELEQASKEQTNSIVNQIINEAMDHYKKLA